MPRLIEPMEFFEISPVKEGGVRNRLGYQRGENRYNAVYSDDFAREVCKMFQDGVPYNLVYQYYQKLYPGTGSTIGSFIHKLYHRKTREHITNQYRY